MPRTLLACLRRGVLALCLLWFGGEALLTLAAGWHLSATSPLAWALRDLTLPVLWVSAWLGDSFSWRGKEMHLNPESPKDEREPTNV